MQVLVVDDEPYMIDYLKTITDWSHYGFDQVYTAGGGSLARDLLDRYEPELMITDIRMPKISGLDLCRHIYEKKYRTKAIILSGYGEFEYAKQAIQYGVSEYLVKPILKEELETALEHVAARFFPETQKKEAGDAAAVLQAYIREHIEEDLSLDLLAGVVHLNPSYLSRYFKETTGENLSGFVTRCKMERAAELLDGSDQKISEIMQRLGYQKSQHFAKIFREQYGVSPNDYKRGIAAGKDNVTK